MQTVIGKWALVTGASSGLGADFARLLAERGCHLALVARRKDLLENLKKEIQGRYENNIEVLAVDLTSEGAAAGILQHLQSKRIDVEVLVNNAGFGTFGSFINRDLSKQLGIIDLNIRAVLGLTHVFANEMKTRKSGYILNVASTASFQAGPNMSVYCASKSFILSWSEALNVELRPLGISVTALCPGPTQTEFFDSSGNIPFLMKMIMMKSEPVTALGVNAMLAGRRLVIPGLLNRFMVISQRFIPRSWVIRIAGLMLR